MVHGPRGLGYDSVCQDDKGYYTKGFPEPFQTDTKITTESYVKTRRRDTGRKIEVRRLRNSHQRRARLASKQSNIFTNIFIKALIVHLSLFVQQQIPLLYKEETRSKSILTPVTLVRRRRVHA